MYGIANTYKADTCETPSGQGNQAPQGPPLPLPGTALLLHLRAARPALSSHWKHPERSGQRPEASIPDPVTSESLGVGPWPGWARSCPAAASLQVIWGQYQQWEPLELVISRYSATCFHFRSDHSPCLHPPAVVCLLLNFT